MCNDPNSEDVAASKSPVEQLRTAATREDQQGDETPEWSLREEAPRSLASSWLAEAQAYLEDHKAGRARSTRRMVTLQGTLEPLLASNGIPAQPLAAFTCSPSEDKLAGAFEVLERLMALDIAGQSVAPAPKGQTRVARRGPLRLPPAEAVKRVKLLRKWASVQEGNSGRSRRERTTKATFLANRKETVTEQDFKAYQAWYHKHVESDEFPRDPRDLKDDQLRKLFPKE